MEFVILLDWLRELVGGGGGPHAQGQPGVQHQLMLFMIGRICLETTTLKGLKDSTPAKGD